MAGRSVMKHQFSQVPSAEIPRSQFDRSHGVKTTITKAGDLVPIFIDEALPGDTMNLRMTAFARMATPIKPIMDNQFMETFFFAVPYRLVWENWQRFNGEQDDPGDSTDYVIPTQTAPAGGYPIGGLADHFGIPTGVDGLQHSSLFHRAYRLIWNEWFRDQNLQNRATVDFGDSGTTGDSLLQRGKRHDYFTSCLPWPQKGDAVTVPVGDQARITGIGRTGQSGITAGPTGVYETAGNQRNYGAYVPLDTDNLTLMAMSNSPTGNPSVYAKLDEVTGFSINSWREAFQLQRMLERDARGGTRYTEIVRSHFGVISPDQRLQRPEYLGGGSSMVNINPVAQTAQANAAAPGPGANDTPQGNLAAIGTVSLNNHGFTKSFTEHCIVIGLVNVRADITYQQGLDRMFSRSTRYDFYWPALAHLGEQAVLNKEIYAQGTADDELVFGYQERFAEMRYKPSRITGKFRSADPASLDAWHLSQDFADLPVLGTDFIKDDPPIDRVIAVPSEPHYLFDGYIRYLHARPMPMYGVPGMIDHF